MNKKQLVKAATASAALLILFATPQLRAAGGAVPDSPPQGSNPAPRPKVSTNVLDYLGGLNLTDEQKAKIGQIQREQKSHYEAIVNDQALDADKKQAMIEGYRRIENTQVFDVLTPEQQSEVRRRFQTAKRSAAADQKRTSPATPKP
jgi:Spy/CpxP family protein refolding chaperone